MIFELSFMFIIILGRWILPKGDISHSALSQLLLVYLSLASDILDLLTLFHEEEIQASNPMVYLVLTVFSLCMLQFALNLTATRGRSFRAEFDQTRIEIHQSAPSRSPTLFTSKSFPGQRPLLAKLLSRSTPSSTTRPLGSKAKRSKARPTNVNPPDTIFENADAIQSNELQLSPSHLSKYFFLWEKNFRLFS